MIKFLDWKWNIILLKRKNFIFLNIKWWFQELHSYEYAWSLEYSLLADFLVFPSRILSVVEITIITAEIRSEAIFSCSFWRLCITQGSRVPGSADMNSTHVGQLQSLYTLMLCNPFFIKTVSDKLEVVNENSSWNLSDTVALDSTSFFKKSTPFVNNPFLL